MTPGAKFLELIEITTAFGNLTALDKVSLTVAKGEVVCIIGPSGCGKSTLLRTVNWLTPPNAGTVRLEGQIVGDAAKKRQTALRVRTLNRFRARMGMVFQQFNTWPHLTARDNVARPQRVVLGRSAAEAAENARKALEDVGLGDKIDDWPEMLSGGQKQRLAIARALAMDPSLMLLDEPTSALDPELVSGVLGVLKALAGKGMTMLIVTHELGFASQVADRVVFMEAGRIVEEGPPSQVLRAPRTDRLKGFLAKLSATQMPAVAPVKEVLDDKV
ncbi:MAG: amino acid ABC transporter ATP-binding protein [Pseudomonadota bacterium]